MGCSPSGSGSACIRKAPQRTSTGNLDSPVPSRVSCCATATGARWRSSCGMARCGSLISSTAKASSSTRPPGSASTAPRFLRRKGADAWCWNRRFRFRRISSPESGTSTHLHRRASAVAPPGCLTASQNLERSADSERRSIAFPGDGGRLDEVQPGQRKWAAERPIGFPERGLT